MIDRIIRNSNSNNEAIEINSIAGREAGGIRPRARGDGGWNAIFLGLISYSPGNLVLTLKAAYQNNYTGHKQYTPTQCASGKARNGLLLPDYYTSPKSSQVS